MSKSFEIVQTTDGNTEDKALRLVTQVLNRHYTYSPTLSDLLQSTSELSQQSRRQSTSDACSDTLFAFDTNALLRLGADSGGADAIDYIRKHPGPLVLPGQAIQESWNNLHAGVRTRIKELSASITQTTKKLEEISEHLEGAIEPAKLAWGAVEDAYKDWIDPAALDSFKQTIEAINSHTQSIVAFVPRIEFSPLAEIRKKTKTPPGFRDDAGNHGDFYLWADFLYGIAQTSPTSFDRVVMVTNDTKKDWSTSGAPHPILVSEAISVSGGKKFEIWRREEFVRMANG